MIARNDFEGNKLAIMKKLVELHWGQMMGDIK